MDVPAPPKDFAGPQHSSANSDGDFDCNICLEFAMDPVVTLCGHLYCSACIGKWLMFEDENASLRSCPVCKASLSQDSLVHLYRRGSIPKRMRQSRDHRPRPPARRHRYDGGYGGEFPSSSSNSRPQLTNSTAGGVLGEMEVALYYYSSRYHRVGGTGGGAMVRQPERGAERLLRIWLFLLCSIALCVLLF